MLHSLFPASLAMLLWVATTHAAAPADPAAFQAHVRPTDPLTPEQQLATFQLPPGFTVTCFAAEPDIPKPMNMAFDGRGRLWMTGSVEYPFAAEPGQGRDVIKILEDTDGDGRADKITTFADGLNIPIGLYPYRNGVVAYSIPHIWFLEDTDGDDRADRRTILYRDLGTPRDTHGLQNAFRRGFDGWLYICHGFANQSVIRGTDGSRVELESGNTYRVRLDGSRVEQFTRGQVNPFGMGMLPNGDLITADCHSKPLTMLLRGGCYPSFGRPHDGLGFVPSLMEHSHGSTAISGVAIATGAAFPEKFRGSLFVGNVMTSRVHRDVLQYDGATPRAIEQEDFVRCDDPWFRPVDLRMGPDGALYIADFYNRIIGHYEVRLDHPLRDRHRGRIWRIAPLPTDLQRATENDSTADVAPQRRASAPPTASPAFADLNRATATQLVATLAHDNLTARMLATDQLSDRLGRAALPALRAAIQSPANSFQSIHAHWVLFRLEALTIQDLRSIGASDQALARMHAMRILAEWPVWDAASRALAIRGMRDPDPQVRRVAAEACGTHRDPQALPELVRAIAATPSSDVMLRQAIRIAIRDTLAAQPESAAAQLSELSQVEQRQVADICALVPHSATATRLLELLGGSAPESIPLETQLQYLVQIQPHLSPDQLDAWLALVRDRLRGKLAWQLDLLEQLQRRRNASSPAWPAAIDRWARELVDQALAHDETPIHHWHTFSPHTPWALEMRGSADGAAAQSFLSSLPGGEQRTGVLRSPTFVIPETFSFYLCGHRGYPDQPPSDGNQVCLRLVADDSVLHRAFPPRNDTASKITWNSPRHAGQRGYLELVDGLDLDAYAWLAVARFHPPVIQLPQGPIANPSHQERMAIDTIARGGWSEYLPQLYQRLESATEADVQIAAARAVAQLGSGMPEALALADLVAARELPAKLRRGAALALAEAPHLHGERLRELVASLNYETQRIVAERLAATTVSSQRLADWMGAGVISAQLLHNEQLWQRLRANTDGPVGEVFEQLKTQAVSVEQAVVDKLPQIVELAAAATNRAKGRAVFEKNCAICHQIGETGNLVGPQLDGIGNRGMQRIAEDILLPNRNVDKAFRVSLIELTDGQVLSGLRRRDEADATIFANNKGEEFLLPSESIVDLQPSTTSLMPDGFARTLSDDELAALIGYLGALTE